MNDYKIIVLGTSGSGKTVLLSSLYHKLSVQRDNIGFYISIPPLQQRILVDKYRQVKAGEWPRGTQRKEMSEWTFTCSVQNEAFSSYPALSFTYLDYAGEIITNASVEEVIKFDEQVAEAEVLLGILDGHKILSLISHVAHPSGSTIDTDLDFILPTMMRSNKPIHFIITKWDLLAKRHSFAEVRSKLLEHENFRQIILHRRRQKNQVRLIPVSAVGEGFAELQPNGTMKPIPGMIPEPFQVEMTLACALFDGLEARLREVVNKKAQIEKQTIQYAAQYTTKEAIGKFFGGVLRDLKSLLPTAYRFSDPILYKMIDALESGAIEKEQRIAEKAEEQRRTREESLRKVQNEESALSHVIDRSRDLTIQLGSSFPGANFSDLFPRTSML